MGSRGSVIPLFRRLIDEDRPLTVTDPNMTRFLMTLDQSVELVVHAMTSARGGEIFVRKAPASTVADLANAMARKFSSRGASYPVTTIGIRAGEKTHEVLVNEYEMRRSDETIDFFTVRPEYQEAKLHDVPAGAEYTSANTRRLTSYEELSSLLDAMGQIESYV
jgi:FlaA1/EpsC-like NDP-sugar epimerase